MKTAFRFMDGRKDNHNTQDYYYFDPPLEDYDGTKHETAVISSAHFGESYECYIFPCDRSGKWLSYVEMPGSMRGTISHDDVFDNIGYRLIEGDIDV